MRLLMGADRPLTDAAAQALASYKQNAEALRLLVNFASARQQREADRILAIRAIAETNQKSAAEFLVSLVLRDDDAQRVRNAAADALVDPSLRRAAPDWDELGLPVELRGLAESAYDAVAAALPDGTPLPTCSARWHSLASSTGDPSKPSASATASSSAALDERPLPIGTVVRTVPSKPPLGRTSCTTPAT